MQLRQWQLWQRAAAALAGWARRMAAAVLSSRPVPQHVAFIMDGNRRFAEARQLRKVEGHTYGYQRLIDALEWCLELGVRCVSVYAFSIDNYRRSGEEVDTLMRLAQDKLDHMLQEHDVLERHGVQVRVIGDLSLAPQEVQAAAARIMAATRHHDRAVLNLCFSYTASEELQHALDGVAAAQRATPSSSSDSGGSCSLQLASSLPAVAAAAAAGSGPSIAALEAELYTAGCPAVDLLVRTSGETRLSDFLLWQSRHALLVFTQVLWPDFGFLDLAGAILEYQRHAAHLNQLRQLTGSQAAAAEAVAAVAAAAGAEQAAATQKPVTPEAAAAAGAAGQEQQAAAMAWRQLQPLKVQQQQQQAGSPCSVASPASPSSPSSKSDASEEAAGAVGAALAAAVDMPAPAAAAPRLVRQRRTVAAAAALG